MNVSTTPVNIGSEAKLVQNLGAGALYVAADASVSSTTGYQIASGDAVALGYSSMPWYVVSASTSDVRVLIRGAGVFGL